MTLPTFDSARDEILGLFWAAWQANAAALNGGTAPVVRWDGADENKEYPPADDNWVRVAIRHSASRQAAFGTGGQRRYTREGTVTVQIFTSLSTEQGVGKAEEFAKVARDAYEGSATDSGIWFRRVRSREIGPEPGGWYQINVVADFEYDEVK